MTKDPINTDIERLAAENTEGRLTAVRRAGDVEVTDTSLLSQAPARTDLDHLTLHEERARVEVLREQAGMVSVRKIVRERQETLPVTLTTELIEITVQNGAGQVMLNGEALEPGRTYEIVVHDERAVVQKEVFVHSNVNLRKETRTHTHTENVTLRREELEVMDPQGLVRDIENDQR